MARDDTWQERQEASVARYAHENYEADVRRFRFFQGFIATTLTNRNAAVLDIGCGISPDLPKYVDELGLTNYIGLDPLEGPKKRSYRFVQGMAEDIPLPKKSVDAVICATAWDHVPDDLAAAKEIRRVLKPEGRFYLWQSIHDPDTIALISTLHRLTKGPHMIPLVTLQAAKMSYLMRKRKRDLAQMKRLDVAHERWFTRDGLRRAMRGYGFEIVRELEPYGMASMFIEARLA